MRPAPPIEAAGRQAPEPGERQVLERLAVGAADGQLHVARQSASATARGDVIYVHGSTFGCDLSLFWRMDGVSWADALTAAGFNAWGFDFIGYGGSSRYPDDGRVHGRADQAVSQLLAVVAHVRAANGGRGVLLLAHSWGCTVAAMAAVLEPHAVAALALFGPVATRAEDQRNVAAGAEEPLVPPLQSAWSQYRRFVDDVPAGHPQVLQERHFDAWAAAYLLSDPAHAQRDPSAVQVPAGPVADVQALWSGRRLFDASTLHQPTLVIRGAWDSRCDETDAASVLAGLGSSEKRLVTLPAGTHLLHLEDGRHALHAAVNDFFRGLPAP